MLDEVEVLLADNHLLAVAKPAGIAMVPDESGDESLLERAKRWVKRTKAKPGAVYLGVVHRLDRPVSGVALFARTSKAAARVTRAFREREVRKLYWAIAEGAPRVDAGVLEQWLAKDEATNRVSVVDREAPGARFARTHWRVLARESGRAWFEFEPLTGRPHQLRVAAATLGAPLLGDLKYGAREALADRSIALHAVRLELDHPTSAQRVAIECPPPPQPWWASARSRARA